MVESDKYEEKREEQRVEQLREGFAEMKKLADSMVASGFTRKEAREFIFSLIFAMMGRGN